MSLHPTPPPLLLTKRLTSFLHSNLTPSIESALLVTPTGKLLSYASPAPVSVLRTQSTVCASLWALHSSSASAPSSAASHSSSFDSAVSPSEVAHNGPRRTPIVTLALATGALVVLRRLRCGLLFVCIGPAPEQPPAAKAVAGEEGDAESAGPASIPTQARTSAPPSGATSPLPPSSYRPPPGVPSAAGAGSETESEGAEGSGEVAAAALPRKVISKAEAAMVKRHVEGLAKWLDDNLGGLVVPEEGIGAGMG